MRVGKTGETMRGDRACTSGKSAHSQPTYPMSLNLPGDLLDL